MNKILGGPLALLYYALCGVVASYWFAGDFALKQSGPVFAAVGFGAGAAVVVGAGYLLNLSPKKVSGYCFILVLTVPIGRSIALKFISNGEVFYSLSTAEAAAAVAIGYIVSGAFLAVLRWRVPGFVEAIAPT